MPGSARAHYIYAEILAHEGKLALAAEEAKQARTIDPDVKFTDPEKFRTFEAALLRAQSPAARTPPTRAPVESRAAAQVAPAPLAPATAGVPSWVWLAGLAAIGFVLWRFFARSRGAPMAGGVATPNTGYGTQMQAGMPAELFVTTGERTLVEYLAKPLRSFSQRAMRESG